MNKNKKIMKRSIKRRKTAVFIENRYSDRINISLLGLPFYLIRVVGRFLMARIVQQGGPNSFSMWEKYSDVLSTGM